jgi:hypothetical protein
MDAVLRVKLPLKFGWQPEGAAAEGAMPSLTACATAVAARQRIERMEDLILVVGGIYAIFLICAFKYVERPNAHRCLTTKCGARQERTR